MRLRTKILLILLIVFVLYMAITFSLSRFVVAPMLGALEQELARWDVERCLSALNRETEHLESFNQDWAHWTETYDFVAGNDVEYATRNLTQTVLGSNDIDLIFYLDNGGKVVWSRIRVPETGKLIHLPKFPTDQWDLDNPLLKLKGLRDTVSGIEYTEAGPILLASARILTSPKEGPARGFLIMGRFLDADVSKGIVEQTRVSFRIFPATSLTLPSDEYMIPNRLKGKTWEPRGNKEDNEDIHRFFVRRSNDPELQFYSDPGSRSILLVYVPLRDLNHEPTMVLQARVPRFVLLSAMTSTMLAFGAMLVVGIIVSGVLLLFLHLSISRPLKRLANQILTIGEKADLAARLPVTSKDEIGVLAGAFNNMMNRLEASAEARQSAEERVHHRARMEEMVAAVSSMFLNLPSQDLHEGIRQGLEILGNFLDADNIYLSYLLEPGGETQERYDWYAHGVEPRSLPPGGARYENWPYYSAKMLNLETIHIPDIDDSPPEAARDIESMKYMGIQSFLQVPLPHKGEPLGYLGINSFRKKHHWKDEDIGLLKIVAEVFVAAFLRRQAEDEIRRREARYRRILATTTEGFSQVDPEYRIVEVNDALCRALGYEKDELVGTDPIDLMPPDCREEWREKRSQTDDETVRFEQYLTARDGKQIPFLFNISTFRDEDGDLLGSVAFLTDITELKEAEALREDVERITRHDLKTPLNGIINYADLVLEEEGLSEEQRECLQQMQKAGYQMLDMINRSLDLFKMEKGSYQLDPVPVDLVSITKRVFSELEQLARSYQVELGIELDGHTPEPDEHCIIPGDRSLIHSMVANLVRNAIEASPAENPVNVHLSSEDARRYLRVHNSGVVPQEVRERFFEKYATFGKRTGTGLGTYSARLIAETHGGGIGFESTEEVGTTVEAWFPTGPAESA